MKKKCLTVKHMELKEYDILNEEFFLECSSINQIINENEKGMYLFKALLDLVDSKKKCLFYGKPIKNNFHYIGYYSPDFSCDETFKVKDFFSYSQSFYKNNYEINLKRLLKKFNIDENKKITSLEKKDIELIKLIEAIYHKPDLLFLNEPYKYIDSNYINELNNELITLKENNSTIFINSNKVYFDKKNIDSFFCYYETKFYNIKDLKTKTYNLQIKSNFPLRIKKLIYLGEDNYKYIGSLNDLIEELDLNQIEIIEIKGENNDSIL